MEPFMDPAMQYAAAAGLTVALVTFLLLQPTSLATWLQKKIYLYEVTFALYMLTPTEKFIFSTSYYSPSFLSSLLWHAHLPVSCSTPSEPWKAAQPAKREGAVNMANGAPVSDSILFLTFSMFTLACILYLPDHILTISHRSYYYFIGDAALSNLPWQAADTIGNTASKASEAVLGAATGLAETAYQAAVNTAAAAQEAVNQAAETLWWD